ncbi:class I SAM-dependent methyltransferase [Myxococcota bacterium]|nr:class I SAM-dependent methyltransferase [Myxococcota bacterium]
MNLAAALKSRIVGAATAAADRLGYSLVKNDYYSPVPDRARLAAEVGRWWRADELRGIALDAGRMEALLRAVAAEHGPWLEALPSHADLLARGYGPGFGPVDGAVLAGLVRHFRPGRIVEIGSGLSTFYGTLALEANGAGRYVCIEPFPYPRLGTLPRIERIDARRVETLDPAEFEVLGDGDVLFIDSSHSVRLGGDVVFLYLQVLPRLRPGVIVHVHDIAFPYPIWHPDQVLKGRRTWTEYALVQAFLAFNSDFEVLLSNAWLHFERPDVLEGTIPGYRRAVRPPVSLWIRRRPANPGTIEDPRLATSARKSA